MKKNSASIICLIVVILLSDQKTTYAQHATQLIVADSEMWVSLGTYDTSKVEYDLQSLLYIDSEHISVFIKTTPTTPIIKKLLQENSIGLHPVSAYNGYEYYSCTVREVTIDLKHRRSTTLNTWDYDILGGLLEWIRIPQQPQLIAPSSPESTLIKEVMGVITRVIVADAQ